MIGFERLKCGFLKNLIFQNSRIFRGNFTFQGYRNHFRLKKKVDTRSSLQAAGIHTIRNMLENEPMIDGPMIDDEIKPSGKTLNHQPRD